MQLRRPCSAFHQLLLIPVSLAFAFCLLAPIAAAERVEDLPKPTDYVSDFAHVLSPETVARLDRLCAQLDHSATNAQVAIVTVKNLDGADKADFANRLEEKWKVGRKGTDRGVLVLVSVEDRHYWVEVGYGLEGILPDARVGDIGRLMVPDLRQHDYDGAITTGLVQIANIIAADAKVTLQDQDQSQDPDRGPPADRGPHRSKGSSIGLIFRIILIVLVLVFFGVRGLFGFGLGMLFGGGGRGRWGGGGGGGWGGGGGGDSGGGGFGGFGGGESGGGGAGGDY